MPKSSVKDFAPKQQEAVTQKIFEVNQNLADQNLTSQEVGRYSRHLILPEIGLDGQKKLKNSRVLLVGAGALGSPLALYLAAAGVGTLGLADFDLVEESNLQRQIIHSITDIGRKKILSAKESIVNLNPHINVLTFDLKLDSQNALELFQEFDVIVDGSDNYPARYLINDACALLGKPDVYGAVYRFDGLVTVFDAKRGACLRCLFAEPPLPEETASCGEGGVLGVLPGIIGSIQACETIKLIVGSPYSMVGRLLTLDAWKMRFHETALPKDAGCPLCGRQPVIKELMDYELFCGLKKAGQSAENLESINPVELKRLLDEGADLQIIDIRLPDELNISRFDRAENIPLPELFKNMDKLDAGRTVVLLCKKGEKSLAAIEALQEEGYAGRLLSLAGGINAWAEVVDQSILQY
jgi:adenylyltransferase/sulfurtransferase